MGNVYNATKFGVRALTEGMNLDVAGTPIRISSVDPGFVETEFSDVRFHGDRERAAAVYQGFRPLTADDVADAIAYVVRSEEHTSELQSLAYLVCRLLLEKKKKDVPSIVRASQQ